MAKKQYKKVKDTSRTYPRVDAKEVAKVLGASIVRALKRRKKK